MEKYISNHSAEEGLAPLPSGSRERFMAKVEQKRRAEIRSRRVIRLFSCCAAAAVAVVVLVRTGMGEADFMERKVMKMASCEREIMSMVESHFPYEIEEAANTIRIITSEAIPLSSMLPDELPAKERIRILGEYYDRKIEALERMKSQYQSNNTL